jgi:hypothetical protein
MNSPRSKRELFCCRPRRWQDPQASLGPVRAILSVQLRHISNPVSPAAQAVQGKFVREAAILLAAGLVIGAASGAARANSQSPIEILGEL